jgi:hypothetical protein
MATGFDVSGRQPDGRLVLPDDFRTAPPGDFRIDTTGVPPIETSGRPPSAEEIEREMLAAMSPEDRRQYEFVGRVCEREAYLFKRALDHVLKIMPQPVNFKQHAIEEGPRYDQGTVIVALKVYENVRAEFLGALEAERSWWRRALSLLGKS